MLSKRYDTLKFYLKVFRKHIPWLYGISLKYSDAIEV